MKKTRQMSNTEMDLVREAGALLALNNCSDQLMANFGFNRESCLRAHGKIDNLLSNGLPCPALSALWPDILQKNAAAVDSLIPRAANLPQRRMVVCIDFTYLLKLHAVMQLHGQKVVIGAPFAMKDLQVMDGEMRSCLAPVPENFSEATSYKGEKQKANRMPLGFFKRCHLYIPVIQKSPERAQTYLPL